MTPNEYLDGSMDLLAWQELFKYSIWEGIEEAFDYIGYFKECSLIDLIGE